jgi:hypothetical protein
MPLNYPDNGNFAFSTSASFAMPDPAYISFVNFDFASKDRIGFTKQSPNLFEHSPSGFVGNSSFSFNLLGRYTASGRRHSMYDLEPSPQRGSRFMEYRASKRVNMVSTIVTGVTGAVRNLVVLSYSMAVRAFNTLRPAMVLYPLKASIVIRESFVKVFDGKLVHSLDLRFFGHSLSPLHKYYNTLYTCCQGIVTLIIIRRVYR